MDTSADLERIPERLAHCVSEYRGREEPPRQADSLDEMLADLDFFRRALGETVYYPRAILDIFARPSRRSGASQPPTFSTCLSTGYSQPTTIPFCSMPAPRGTPVFTWRESRQAREYLAANRRPTPLLKIHGCASRPDTIILSGLEYERLRQDDTYLSLLRSVFDEHAVLFLGFGLSDPFDLDLALQQARLAGAAEGEKFAVIPLERCDEIRKKFPHVQVVSYESHSSLAPFLASLACAVG